MAKNVLFITADQWRGECLSCLGHFVQTPNLDALASEGVLFARHFANTAPCGPSRASIHTGLYQHKHGVSFNGVPLDARHTNWALEARNAGLDPVLFGYTDTVSEAHEDGELPGLRPVVRLGKAIREPTAWVDWLVGKGYPIPSSQVELYTKTKKPSSEDRRGDVVPPLEVPADLHDTWFMVDRVIDHIRDRSNWCVHLSLLRPHPPWVAPEPYNRLYPPQELPPPKRSANPGDEADQHPFLAHVLDRKYMRLSRDDRSRDDRRLKSMQSNYFALMTEVDHNLGRLFQALKRSGAWHDTLIVFTSDHGEQLGDHWLIGKLGYFDESFAVPLIVFNPLPEAEPHRGKRVSRFTEGIDIMPTLLDWLDVDVPRQCDGASLLPATTNVDLGPVWRTEARWEYDFGSAHFGARESLGLASHECKLAVLRDTNSKYVHFDGLPSVFFDLGNDPAESKNLAEDPGYRRRVEAAAEKLAFLTHT